MFEEMVILQAAYYGGNIGDVLNTWARFGFFSYVLPFLLIFAMIYGILGRMKVFGEERKIDGIIALTVGLMALQFDFVPLFFQEVFPRLGVGFSIILAILLIAGLFIDPKQKAVSLTLLVVSVIIVIIILVQTAAGVGWYSGQWWYDNWESIAGAIFIIVVLAVVTSKSDPTNEYNPIFVHGPVKGK